MEKKQKKNDNQTVVIPQVKRLPKREQLVKVENNQIYEIMERKDEMQIIAELQGKYLDEFVYEFPQEGKQVMGLSWLGVQEASRVMGGIQTEIVERKEGKDEERGTKWVEIVVKAIDIHTGTSRLGIKRQHNRGRRKDGKIFDIPFYTEIALAKAQRNAIRALLPQTLIKAWIQIHRKGATKTEKKEAEKEIEKVKEEVQESTYSKCGDCQVKISPKVSQYSLEHYGMELCFDCQKKYKPKK